MLSTLTLTGKLQRMLSMTSFEVCVRVIHRQNRRTYRQSTLDSFFRPQTPAYRSPVPLPSPSPLSVTSDDPDDPLALSPADVSLPSTSDGRYTPATPDPTFTPLVPEEEGDSD